MLLATINCFQIPYNIAFSGDNTPLYYVFDVMINICFILDLVISFRTSYINEKNGAEVTNLRLIALLYLRGRFWIDLIASIPIDYIFIPFSNDSSIMFGMFSLLKLVRVLRLSRLITHLNIKNELKISLRLGKLIFFLILYIHCIG